MRVMVFGKTTEDSGKGAPPTAEAFAAMDRFIGELGKAGVFVAAAGLQNNAQAKRVVLDGPGRTVIDGPFAETRELVDGFQIWEVNRPFYEAADLVEFVTPEELATPREGERGKLGVA